jgi:hypothetical protein
MAAIFAVRASGVSMMVGIVFSFFAIWESSCLCFR